MPPLFLLLTRERKESLSLWVGARPEQRLEKSGVDSSRGVEISRSEFDERLRGKRRILYPNSIEYSTIYSLQEAPLPR